MGVKKKLVSLSLSLQFQHNLLPHKTKIIPAFLRTLGPIFPVTTSKFSQKDNQKFKCYLNHFRQAGMACVTVIVVENELSVLNSNSTRGCLHFTT